MDGEKKQRIEKYILSKICERDRDYIPKTMEAFGIARSTAYNYINEMKKEGLLVCGTDFPFEVSSKKYDFVYSNDGRLREEQILGKDIEPLLSLAGKKALNIWRYAFCEMMNNAIEHSSASRICCTVEVNRLYTVIVISDNGVGIFENIKSFLNKNGENYSLSECPAFLLPGKFTTDSSAHSGEGIFFTSQAVDEFFIFSSDIVFSRLNLEHVNKADCPPGASTSVYMKLDNGTELSLREVFDRYSDVDNGFFRTSIPMLSLFPSRFPVARSEARRLFEMISGFSEATLDFDGIENIGQAFVHEFFSVRIKNSAKPIKITLINMNDDVEFMVKRNK